MQSNREEEPVRVMIHTRLDQKQGTNAARVADSVAIFLRKPDTQLLPTF